LISKEELLKIAKQNKLIPIKQERHYLQNLVLLALSEYKLIFKGGTYLWFCHNIDRFSEDLDFTTQQSLDKGMITNIQNKLKDYDINCTAKDITNNAITLSFKLSIAGPLFNGTDRSKCFLWVEISKRENIILEPLTYDIYVPYYKLETKLIRGMNLNEVFSEKVRAIQTRDKARDVYDLYYLITKNNVLPNIELINKKMVYYNSEFNLNEFLKAVTKKEKNWNLEMNGLLFNKVPEFKEVYETIVNAFK
jgi:hypothetical protein